MIDHQQLEFVLEDDNMTDIPKSCTLWPTKREMAILPPRAHKETQEHQVCVNSQAEIRSISTKNLPDIGVFNLGMFQAGWSSKGQLVRGISENSKHRVEMLEVSACMIDKSDELNSVDMDLLIKQLNLHFKYSFPQEKADDAIVPCWRMSCSRAAEQLRELTVQYMKICKSFTQEVRCRFENCI